MITVPEEILAAVLRPGNAGANGAEDHIRVFHTAVAQVRDAFFTDPGALAVGKVLARDLEEVSLAPAQPLRAVRHPLHPAVRRGIYDRPDHRQTVLATGLGPVRKRPDRSVGHLWALQGSWGNLFSVERHAAVREALLMRLSDL